ncbi:MAG: aminotransferase class III [Flavobacteriaceae bacterium]|nr:aminotransferase class III [Flavobacteriaceae bacterium]
MIKKEYGLDVILIDKFKGYENDNYFIKTDKDKFVLKLYSDLTLKLILKAENEFLLFLQKQDKKNYYPKPILFKKGGYVKQVSHNGKPILIRMLSYLEGDFIAECKVNENIISSLGSFLAKFNLLTRNWKNSEIKARDWEWKIESVELIRNRANYISDPFRRNRVIYFIQQYRENILPVYNDLRKSIIHNDANQWNVLVEKDKIAGLIDFGDISYSNLVNEVGIAMTYIAYDKEDVLYWSGILLESYNKILPLKKEEVESLYYIIALRLCMSVSNSAYTKLNQPNNDYISEGNENVWNMLDKWILLGPIQVINYFLKVTGFALKKQDKEKKYIDKRQKYLSKILSLSYKAPLVMEQSAFQYMYDVYGNTFLDAYNNIPHVGHSHPIVVEAGKKQMAKLNTNTRYLYSKINEYAEHLLSYFPSKLNKIFFVNSGSEASDLAIQMAKAHNANDQIIVMEEGYHGHTQTGIEISDYKFNDSKGIGQPKHITKLPLLKNNTSQIIDSEIEKIKKYFISTGLSPSAFISEIILGCAGQVPLSKDYLKKIYSTIRSFGGVCIADEVQTGFGRIGSHFWAFESYDVIPDMVIIGKPMGNGHPIAALVTTEEVAESFEQGVEFFSSFGGNPVSCSIGKAVLEVIEQEELMKRAFDVGNYYLKQLMELKSQFNSIHEVRGSGLFLGVELVNTDYKPNSNLASLIKNQLRESNILIGTDGKHNNVLKTKPPLCFSKENVDEVIQRIEEAINKFN